jgi:uncharacterized protein (TIGR03000 family)
MVPLKWFGGLALAAALVMGASDAEAGHHHHSWGSYGSCGSSGGSYGSWGSCGSSGGSWGSSGGSWGSSGSSGSSGSYGSYGSSGSSGGAPAMTSYSESPSTAVAQSDRAHLTLSVPGDAVVYLSNQRMTLEGTVREFVVPGLKAGLQYRYPVRVDVVREGRTYSASSEQQLQAGQQLNLAFSQSATQPEIVSMRD